MSRSRISTIPVRTFLYDDTSSPVALWTIDQLPEADLLLRCESRRQHRCGEEIESGEVFVWTPRAKDRYGMFNLPGKARQRRQLRKNATDLTKVRSVDVFELRDEFFEIRSPQQGLRFFKEYGIFGEEHRNTFAFVWGLSFADLLQWQGLLRDCWLNEPKDWEALTGRYSRLWQATDILQMPEFSIDLEPHLQFMLRCEGVREAIIAAIYLEKLANVKSSMCHRLDCGVVFNHESRHQRKYCTPDCAHLEAVRMSRLRKAGR